MNAAVDTLPSLPLSQPEMSSSLGGSAEARKRRREILASQRGMGGNPASTTVDASTPSKKFKASDSVSSVVSVDLPSKSSNQAKKAQMKYDPDVPMTKEEAAVWRREQRRKRNRESAAASRQRQRDRITELEEELEDWKTKYNDLMSQIAKVEGRMCEASEDDVDVENDYADSDDCYDATDLATSEALVDKILMSVPCVSPTASPVVSAATLVNVSEDCANEVSEESEEEEEEEPLPSKMISRPATSRIIHPNESENLRPNQLSGIVLCSPV